MTQDNAAPNTGMDAAPPPAGVDTRDAAWVRVPTRLTPDALATLLRDPEVLLRINPYFYFKEFRKTGPAAWHLDFENQSNQQKLALDIQSEDGPGQGLTINYSQGIKRRTIFSIEPFEQGSMLVVTDDYEHLSEAERTQREAEVDKSLRAWGEGLRMFLVRWQRYSWIPGWRGYIRKLWIPMKPSARRVVWLLFLISVVEFFFFLFVLLIWVVEHPT